jgi:hypothetical protein
VFGKTAIAAAAIAIAALAGAGCGGDEETSTVTVTDDGQEATAAAETELAEEGTETAAEEPADSGSEGIVSGEGSDDGFPFRFVLTELTRSGSTVEAGATVEILSQDESASIQVSDLFSDGQFQELADGETEEGFVFDGIALIDTEGAKKYLVARDETGRCVCSNDLSGVFVEPGAPVSLQATLSAPPPEVESVDVVIPNVQTFTDVPLSE